MRVTAENLQSRISSLKQILSECQALEGVIEGIKETLLKAPVVLEEAQKALSIDDSRMLLKVNKILNHLEIDIERAVSAVNDIQTAKFIPKKEH